MTKKENKARIFLAIVFCAFIIASAMYFGAEIPFTHRTLQQYIDCPATNSTRFCDSSIAMSDLEKEEERDRIVEWIFT